jgi:hypothetical protein
MNECKPLHSGKQLVSVEMADLDEDEAEVRRCRLTL